MLETSLEDVISPTASTFSLRLTSDYMGQWRLCDQARCRRARRCSGEPRICIPRLSPLVPEEVRELVVCLYRLKAQGVPVEELDDYLDVDLQLALDEWRRALTAATVRWRRRRSSWAEKSGSALSGPV